VDSESRSRLYLNGFGIPDLDPRGQRVTDDSFLMCFNAHREAIDFVLPASEFGLEWIPVVDTGEGSADRRRKTIDAGAKLRVRARAMIVLQNASVDRNTPSAWRTIPK
jgi:isoamylase